MSDDDRLRYRLLTGSDTVEFCERVSAVLADGYQLYGSPSIAYDSDGTAAIVAQAVILPEAVILPD